jgi:hypothetical protein
VKFRVLSRVCKCELGEEEGGDFCLLVRSETINEGGSKRGKGKRLTFHPSQLE